MRHANLLRRAAHSSSRRCCSLAAVFPTAVRPVRQLPFSLSSAACPPLSATIFTLPETLHAYPFRSSFQFQAQGFARRRCSAPARQRKPVNLAVDDWQRALRRQFGREQPFELENLGDEPVFSEFSVYDPASQKNSYRVWVRGDEAGDNHCTCPDFATNDLGTCKRMDLALRPHRRITRKRRDALAAGFPGTFSELFLDYAGQRRVRLRPGQRFPGRLARAGRRTV